MEIPLTSYLICAREPGQIVQGFGVCVFFVIEGSQFGKGVGRIAQCGDVGGCRGYIYMYMYWHVKSGLLTCQTLGIC